MKKNKIISISIIAFQQKDKQVSLRLCSMYISYFWSWTCLCQEHFWCKPWARKAIVISWKNYWAYRQERVSGMNGEALVTLWVSYCFTWWKWTVALYYFRRNGWLWTIFLCAWFGIWVGSPGLGFGKFPGARDQAMLLSGPSLNVGNKITKS